MLRTIQMQLEAFGVYCVTVFTALCKIQSIQIILLFYFLMVLEFLT